MNVHAATLDVDDGPPHCYRHPGRETLVSCSECGRPDLRGVHVLRPGRDPVPRACKHRDRQAVAAADAADHRPRQRSMRPRRRSADRTERPRLFITVSRGPASTCPAAESSSTGLSGPRGLDGDWCRLVTAMFLHGSISTSPSTCSRSTGSAPSSRRHSACGGFARLLRLGDRGIYRSTRAELAGRRHGRRFRRDLRVIGALLILEYLATGSLMGQAMGLILVNLVSRSPCRHLDRWAYRRADRWDRRRPTRSCDSACR